MDAKKKPIVVITRGVTRDTLGLTTGYHFDYGDRDYVLPLGMQHNAFKKILSLIDKGYDVQLKDCTLSGIYQDIQMLQQNAVSEIEREIAILRVAMGEEQTDTLHT